MRAPIAVLAASLLFAACVPMSSLATSDPDDVYDDDSWEPPPVGVTIARAEGERLLLSTNQPAYVAVFELNPGRGVSMVYPLSPSQRGRTLAGTQWINLLPRTMRDDRSRLDRVAGTSPVRYLYALASRNPLRLMDPAFDDEYLYRVLTMSAYRANDTYETAGALSWQFLPAEQEEDWGEDLFTVDASRLGRERLARVYCRDGSVIYVHDEIADRAACAWRGRAAGRGTSRYERPDSVVTSGGHHYPGVATPRTRPPVFRVPRPTDVGGSLTQPRVAGAIERPAPRADTLRDSPRRRPGDSVGVRPPRPTPVPTRPGDAGLRPAPAEPAPRDVPKPREEPDVPVRQHPRAEPPADAVGRPVHAVPATPAPERPVEKPAERPAPAPREERPDTAPSPRPVPAPRERPVRADSTARVPVAPR